MPTSKSALVYIGPIGLGLGFTLSGIDVVECDGSEKLISLVRQMKEEALYSLIFVDESLVQPVLPEIEQLNQDPVPAIVLLPSASSSLNVTQEKMKRLMIKAVGSDIVGNN